MCGRFALFTPMKELAAVAAAEPLSELTPFAPSWNVCPQQHVPVATEVGVDGEQNVQRHFRLMQWGFRPSWAKPSNREPINARRETVHDKPMFRRAAEQRRGVVPANGWYEWMTTPQGKTPWFHKSETESPLFMAALWEGWSKNGDHLESCVLLTQEANLDCREVHDRMPVLLTSEGVSAWLSKGVLPAPPAAGVVVRYPVSRAVNNVREDHPGLVQPIPRLFDHEYGV